MHHIISVFPTLLNIIQEQQWGASWNSECYINQLLGKSVCIIFCIALWLPFLRPGSLFISHFLIPTFLPLMNWNFFMKPLLSWNENIPWIYLLRQRHLCSHLKTQSCHASLQLYCLNTNCLLYFEIHAHSTKIMCDHWCLKVDNFHWTCVHWAAILYAPSNN